MSAHCRESVPNMLHDICLLCAAVLLCDVCVILKRGIVVFHMSVHTNYTVGHKKCGSLYLLVTLANINQFSTFFIVSTVNECCMQPLQNRPHHVKCVCKLLDQTLLIIRKCGTCDALQLEAVRLCASPYPL